MGMNASVKKENATLKQTTSDPRSLQNTSSDSRTESGADLILPVGAVVSILHRRVCDDPVSPILYIVRSTARPEALADHLKLFGGELTAARFSRAGMAPRLMPFRQAPRRWGVA